MAHQNDDFMLDLTKSQYSSISMRIQCVKRNVDYRFLIGVEDEDVISRLEHEFGFESSYQRKNDCYCVYSFETVATKDLTDDIKDMLLGYGYKESLKFFTERSVNRAGPDERYSPDPDLNLLEEFCAEDVKYEINYVFIKDN